jgi:hypothetical protein
MRIPSFAEKRAGKNFFSKSTVGGPKRLAKDRPNSKWNRLPALSLPAVFLAAQQRQAIAWDASPDRYPHFGSHEVAEAHSPRRKPWEKARNQPLAAKRRQHHACHVAVAASRLARVLSLFCRLTPAATCCRRFATRKMWVTVRTQVPGKGCASPSSREATAGKARFPGTCVPGYQLPSLRD